MLKEEIFASISPRGYKNHITDCWLGKQWHLGLLFTSLQCQQSKYWGVLHTNLSELNFPSFSYFYNAAILFQTIEISNVQSV